MDADAVLRISASASTSNGMNANQPLPVLSLLRNPRVNEDEEDKQQEKEGEERTAPKLEKHDEFQ